MSLAISIPRRRRLPRTKSGKNCELSWGQLDCEWAGKGQQFPRLGIPLPQLSSWKADHFVGRLPLDFGLAVETRGDALGDECPPLLINIYIFNLF